MPLSLSTLPTDIILEVVNFLDLPDPISLLSTCSYIYRLSNERSFWLSVLETTRKKSPIACPRHTDLSQYTLEALKDLAISWLKLQSNWNRPFPRLAHPVTSTALSEDVDIIFLVPGTDILLLSTAETVLCWDVKLTAPFPLPAIEIDGPVVDVSAPSEVPGSTSVAFLVRMSDIVERRHVVTIKHEAGKAISFTGIYSEFSGPSGSHFKSVFLTEEVVGTVVVVHNRQDCTVTVGALTGSADRQDSTSVLKIPHTFSYQDEMMVCFAYEGHLYQLIEDGHSVQIQHISRNSLLSGECEQAGLYSSDVLVSSPPYSSTCMIPSTPQYGVGAIFIRRTDTHLSISLVPATLTDAVDNGVSSPLTFGASCVSEIVQGKEMSMWLDHSGFNAGFVVQSATAINLLLVRYHPDTKSISQHTLEVPESIDLDDPNVVCVDDTAGAVHLIDKQGVLSTLRYV
ncbi:hypothetical protein C8F04DRAFT_623271 [Mycena alexandri]|uniref:F-box domain-containing protein n=1 Tax=Mycena alexandri TaxID=1745969 RepID=A0AAD6SX34_9AGAR|nr:hypothetical protein C8F04DRAFT_623271 [Mycena alexandri]